MRANRKQLTDAGIVLKKNTVPSVDLEPEYIATDNTTAYITLQEANALVFYNITLHITYELYRPYNVVNSLI